ncbi:MAG: hypothetical protein JXA79_12910 [Deltaproteobacteria bacterium]|nr:hypothetical protein [Deltaproteobacteria bacterium]
MEQVVNDLKETYGNDRVMGQTCDVTEYSQVQTLWNVVKKQFGKVDIWVNRRLDQLYQASAQTEYS